MTSNNHRLQISSSLEQTLSAATRRLRWRDGLWWMQRALVGGLLLGCLLMAVARFWPALFPTPFVGTTSTSIMLIWLTLGLVLLGLVAVLVYTLLRAYPAATVARQLDSNLHLDERISTAVELSSQSTQSLAGVSTHIREAQLRDTESHLVGVDLKKAFPLPLAQRWIAAAALLAALIGAAALFPSAAQQAWQQQSQEEAIAQEEEAAQLEEIQTTLLENEAFLESLQEEPISQPLEALLEQLQEGELNPEELLATLSEAEETLGDLYESAAIQQQALDAVADALGQFDETAQMAEALGAGNPADAAGLLQSAADAIPSSSAEGQQQMADALNQAAAEAAAAGNQALAEALRQAAESLQASAAALSNPSTAAELAAAQAAAQSAMQQAADALADAAQQLANQEALQEALNNIQSAREQLAQAGQGSGAGQGQAGQAGQGQAGAGSGSGQGEGGNGIGYTDSTAPDTYDETLPSLFIGGEEGEIVDLNDQGATDGIPLAAVPSNPNRPAAPALVPYNQVYGEYTDAANQALDDTYIPLGMKDFVRNYFGALEPGASE